MKGLLALEPGAAGALPRAAALALVLLGPACHQREPYEATMARATADSRRTQIQTLEKMIAQAESGELVTTDQIAIGISEDLVKTLLKVSLPPTIVVAERVSIKFESAQTYFRGGQAGILFRAKGTSVDLPDASATLELGGGLEDFNFEGGKLAARVRLKHFSIIESSIGDLAAGVFDGLVRGHLDVLENAIPPIEIPVQLEQSIRIGGLSEGAVVAKPGVLPLSISVSQVIPTNERLWVLLKANAGPWQVTSTEKAEDPKASTTKPAIPKAASPRPAATKPAASEPEAPKEEMKRKLLALILLPIIGAGAYLYWVLRPPVLAPPPTEAELAALLAKRDELQARFGQAVAAHGEKSLAHAPKGGIMIGIPTSFTRSILEQVVTGLFGEVTLTLKNLKVHKAGEVKVKAVFGKKTVGKYILDVQIPQVQGILRPGKPEVTFTKDRIALTLPVRLAEGGGNADIRLQWDSKGLAANMICGDLDVTKSVTGGVIPQDYTVGGAFKIGSSGDAITLAPDFPKEIEVRLFVDPSEQAWKAVEEVIKERSGACQATLNKIDIKEILGNIVGRGFNVKIPQKLIKPVRLPAGVKQSLEIQGISLALQLKPTGLLVSSDRIWYGADLALETRPASSKTSSAPKASPSPSRAPAVKQ